MFSTPAGPRRPPRLALSLLALALAWPATGVQAQTSGTARPPAQNPSPSANLALPSLGDGEGLTVSAERRLGDRIARSIYRDPDYLDDPMLVDYLQLLWQPLLAAAKQRGEVAPELAERLAWELMISRDRSVNAFALPGGYLGVNLGLLAVTERPEELASVLAHELSHVSQRHIARMMSNEQRMAPWMIAAMVLGALAAGSNPQAAGAAVAGGTAVAAQQSLKFSRDMEREADRVGFSLMQPAGFAPQGFVAMFDKLQAANRLNDNGSWPWLRSHPLTTQRIADMHSRLPKDEPPAPAAPLVHAIMVARARVLAQPGIDLWRQWLQDAQDAGIASRPLAERVRVRTQGVLAAQQLKDLKLARALFEPLQVDVRQDAAAARQARLMDAELALAEGDAAAALKALGPTTDKEARPELLLRTQALLAAGAAASVAGPLQTRVTLHPDDGAAWQALAQVWHQQGQMLRSIRAEAEVQVAHYDYAAAVDRLRAGQDLARKGGGVQDYIEASIIDTRLRAVKSLLDEQTRERRLDQ